MILTGVCWRCAEKSDTELLKHGAELAAKFAKAVCKVCNICLQRDAIKRNNGGRRVCFLGRRLAQLAQKAEKLAHALCR
jgi:hypothetical protein